MTVRFGEALGLFRSLVVYHGRPWRRRGFRRFYASFVGPDDLVFDIGAHVGNRSRVLVDLGARVVALEPQPLFASFLRRTLAGRGVTILEKAVGRDAGSATLRISSLHPTVSTLSDRFVETVADTEGFRQVNWDRTAVVEVVTLDAMIERYGPPRFCKIDVEGHEAEILAGLSEPIPVVAFEFLGEAPAVTVACLERLEALGSYRFNLVVGEEARFALAEWTDARSILQAAAAAGRSGDIYARLEDGS